MQTPTINTSSSIIQSLANDVGWQEVNHRHSKPRAITHCILPIKALLLVLRRLHLTQTGLHQKQRWSSKHCTFWAQASWLSLLFALVHSLHWCLVPVHLLKAPVSIFLCDQSKAEWFFSKRILLDYLVWRIWHTNFDLIIQKTEHVYFSYYAKAISSSSTEILVLFLPGLCSIYSYFLSRNKINENGN